MSSKEDEAIANLKAAGVKIIEDQQEKKSMLDRLNDLESHIKNNYESKCSMKVETNSRGHNTTVHIYEGCTKEQIDDTIRKTIYSHIVLQKELVNAQKLAEESEEEGE